MKLSYQVLVAIVECEDGEPSDDVEEWTMREFGELADAERFAEGVYSNNADAEVFTISRRPMNDNAPRGPLGPNRGASQTYSRRLPSSPLKKAHRWHMLASNSSGKTQLAVLAKSTFSTGC
jgi:hypothetical protein